MDLTTATIAPATTALNDRACTACQTHFHQSSSITAGAELARLGIERVEFSRCFGCGSLELGQVVDGLGVIPFVLVDRDVIRAVARQLFKAQASGDMH